MTASATSADTPVTRLPPYFPTSLKECTASTDLFFSCFEQNALMKTPTDTTSAKRALLQCQSELRAYMTCMEKHLGDGKRSWWKFW
ncbi:hypothetical protein C3747_20g261c [Trypanosoma cruzi]|uniref:Uncharacterized protein n=2 Tax=Trypanosoma cruzi TaxID=5693 RepID=Q4DB98_TRYCC|nr:hypothetical protein, conserved [Trypanosoma cruzi]EAN89800.1 hypothetical protein, conserved [Trypanosoma cruzi]KAF8292099.1 hypothetical protein TcYC6_0119280 [Trypanosoma cruzi]PWV17000.1 hypothetical protein C3747_20g261c [Trypanosoma cruzi]|eukprot:XP_811651.1 hypothetical protein [Trypanosoma cruzi strain CL Brener]